MEQNSRIEQLIASLIQVIGRAALPPDKISEFVGRGRAQLRAFNMCDGNHTQIEIAKKLRIDQGQLSRTLTRWVENGIAFRVGEGKELRFLHIYPIPTTTERRAKAKVKARRRRGRRASRR
jgi:DNA-binding MarR family transcriptional regulator